MTEPADKDPPAKTREQLDAEAEIALRNEFIVAMRACRLNERKWLRALIKTGGNAYAAGRLAGIGRATVFRCQRTPRTQRVATIIEQIMRLDEGISLFTQIREYRRQAYSKLPNAFYPKGHSQAGELMPPHEWDEDTASAICEYGTNKDGQPYIKMHAKGPALGAIDKLRNFGPPQRIELTGKDGEALNASPAVMVVPGMVTEAGWAAAASAQQTHLAEAEGKFVEPSREPDKK